MIRLYVASEKLVKGGADEILDQIQSLTGGGYAHVFLRR